MKILPLKTIGFSLNEHEANELIELLGHLKINYPELSAKEVILALVQKTNEAVKALTNDNQDVNSGLIGELREENETLIRLNQDLTESNLELKESNEELNSDNFNLKEDYNALEKETPETKEVIKNIPIGLSDFQFIVELNYFQLSLAAHVANEHSVESLYNKQAQLNPVAFCRMEGSKKDRIGQVLKNTFMGVQFNYHKGDSYLPDNVLSSGKIKKAFEYHKKDQEQE